MEQSSAKGNKRIKLWLFSCEESKLIILTSFLLYMLSIDALEKNSLYRKKGWGMDNRSYCCILPQCYWQIVYQHQILRCRIFYLSYTFMYLQLSPPDICFPHSFSIVFDGNFCSLYCEMRFKPWKGGNVRGITGIT